MHAYLLIGNSDVEGLSSKLNAKILDFPIAKIEDVRALNNLIRLSFSEPTLIVAPNIHEATPEALNAFLKNLEEPQPNIYFALTAPSTRKVLPTIVSRCQVIKTQNSKYELQDENEIKEFLVMNSSQKMAFFDKIKERSEAIKFIEDLVFFLHEKKNFKNMELLIKTLTRLKANGNVNLQLTNLAINYNG